MQVSALRYFLETASSGSIRKAAERLHVTPTAIGRQIENLEQYVQAPLFERGVRGMRLTEAGEVLAGRLSPLIRELEEIKTGIHDLRGLKRGSVSIVAAEALSSGFLAGVLSRFRAEHPGVIFKITLGGADHTFEALRNDSVDVGLTLNAPRKPDIAVVASAQITYVAAVSPRHPLAKRKRVRMSELGAHPLAVPDTSFGARRAMDRAAHAEGIRLEPAYSVNSLAVMKGLAQAGAAVIFAPLLAMRDEIASGALVPMRLDNQSMEAVEVSVCVRRGRRASHAATSFTTVLADALKQLRPSGL
ncbi:MAG: LysR family transcriptional regulator [Pseudacidovorax sp.]|nr:LysR family transcriptional regulator [Pseudacidovorax sp.]